MSVISQIKWKLASTEKKLATLKKRELTIGVDARSSMAMISVPSHI